MESLIRVKVDIKGRLHVRAPRRNYELCTMALSPEITCIAAAVPAAMDIIGGALDPEALFVEGTELLVWPLSLSILCC